ncbi:hypothetical protein N0V90_002154 [Kalmusia sp. IMI 367209]|nr:hypothetical protein N0V90_002154 [Kalmusia sp. IMI 367209]
MTVATDVLLCLMPWPYLWKLHMPKKQRVILCILFGGGTGIPPLRPLAARLWPKDLRTRLQASYSSAKTPKQGSNSPKQSEWQRSEAQLAQQQCSDTTSSQGDETHSGYYTVDETKKHIGLWSLDLCTQTSVKGDDTV